MKRGKKLDHDKLPALRSPAAPDASVPLCPAAAILSCPRRPQQQRGERRVAAILDAAAELISEMGPGGLTVQELAVRAHTSKGSLYHFFPDLQSVLRALANRHATALGELTRPLIADRVVDWSALTVTETVTRFIAPLDYLAANPDFLALARLPHLGDEQTRRLTPICDLADHILRHRYPGLTSQARLVRASTIVAVLDGIVSYSLRSDDVDPYEMVVELSAVLAGYIMALDAAFGPG